MLTLKDTQYLVNEVEKILKKEGAAKEVPVGSYARMQYPIWFPCFRFKVKEYFIENFGNVMIMQTKAMARMYLVTMSFTPSLGTDLPYLLIDSMSLGKKRSVFVEYYDCTTRKQAPNALVAVAAQYKHLPEYEEKKAWYVPLRTSYSLMKGNTKKEEAELVCMLLGEVRAYVKLAQTKKERKPGNIEGLRTLRERMIREGNPSTNILTKMLGEEGAAGFYRSYIMPLD